MGCACENPCQQGAEVASDTTVKEYTEPGATLADFLASPRGRMALLGASRPVEENDSGGGFRCNVEQIRVLSFTVDLILTCTIAPLKGAGGMGGHKSGGAATGITVTVAQAEIRGLPGYAAFSRMLDVGCVNDITWRPTADGSTAVSSAARIMARGDDSSPIGRGLEAALTVPVVGAAMRAVGLVKSKFS
jgi:hypothetical protein